MAIEYSVQNGQLTGISPQNREHGHDFNSNSDPVTQVPHVKITTHDSAPDPKRFTRLEEIVVLTADLCIIC